MRKEVRLKDGRSRHQQEQRRNNLNQKFKEHREQIANSISSQQEQEFNSIYPNIDQHNFKDQLPFLLAYSYNEQYNYRLVIFGSYLHDLLLEYPHSQEGLELLESLSQFQQLQLPQTQELAQVLVNNMQYNCKRVLYTVANLLSHSRYCSALRDMLIQKAFVEKGVKALRMSDVPEALHNKMVTAFVQTLCCMATTHPTIEYPQFQLILQQLKQFSQDQESLLLLFSKLSSLCCSLDPELKRAGFIYQIFEEELLQHYFAFEEEIVVILYFCINSKLGINSSFHPLLTKSLTSSNPNIKQRLLLILDSLYQSQEKSQYFLCSQNLVGVLLVSFREAAECTKLSILRFLVKLMKSYLGQILRQMEMVSEIEHTVNIPQLLSVLKYCLQFPNSQMKESAVDAIYQMLEVITEVEHHKGDQMLARMNEEGLIYILTHINESSVRLSMRVGKVLKMWSGLQSEETEL